MAEPLGIALGYVNPELGLEGHYKLDGVDRIGAQVIDKQSVAGYLVFIHVELLHDDLLDTLENSPRHDLPP